MLKTIVKADRLLQHYVRQCRNFFLRAAIGENVMYSKIKIPRTFLEYAIALRER